MPDPKAKDTFRGNPNAEEPTPNEVAGFFKPNEDNSRELTSDWVPPVDPSELDPDVHVEVISRAEREEESIASRPLNPDAR